MFTAEEEQIARRRKLAQDLSQELFRNGLWCLILLFVVVAALLGLGPLQPTFGRTSEAPAAWVFRLRHKDYGHVDVHISKAGVVLVTPMASFLSRPATEEVCVFNDATKKYACFSKEDARRRTLLETPRDDRPRIGWHIGKWEKQGEQEVGGLTAIVFKQLKRRGNTTVVKRVWVCPEKQCLRYGQYLSKSLDYVAHTPIPISGLPVKSDEYRVLLDEHGAISKEGPHMIDFELLSCKPEKFEPSRFKIPADYQHVADEYEVIGLGTIDGKDIFDRR